jgi:phage shock protein C
MTRDVNVCRGVVGRLMAALEEGTGLSAEDRVHLETCPECSRLLQTVHRLEQELDAEAQAAGTAGDAEHEAAETRVGRAVDGASSALRTARRRRWGALVLAAVAFAAWQTWRSSHGRGLALGEAAVAFIFLAAIVGAAVVLPILLIRELGAAGRERRIYKRVRGSWIAGVCVGLAEASGLSVSLIRLTFVMLALFGKSGVFLYLLLSLALDVHPEDREHLWTFKLRRWLKRRFSSLRFG